MSNTYQNWLGHREKEESSRHRSEFSEAAGRVKVKLKDKEKQTDRMATNITNVQELEKGERSTEGEDRRYDGKGETLR